MYEANFDGSSKGNPGPSQIGFVITNNGKEVYSLATPIVDGTNNVAEYKALIATAKELVEMEVDEVVIRGDSLLVVNQVNGLWKIKKDHLKDLANDALTYLNKIPKWELEWISRDKNSAADSLAQG